jgi:hypothetical protein
VNSIELPLLCSNVLNSSTLRFENQNLPLLCKFNSNKSLICNELTAFLTYGTYLSALSWHKKKSFLLDIAPRVSALKKE